MAKYSPNKDQYKFGPVRRPTNPIGKIASDDWIKTSWHFELQNPKYTVEHDEQEMKCCVPITLTLTPQNETGDLNGKLMIQNKTDETQAFMMSYGSPNRGRYSFNPRAGKISPGAFFTVEVLSNLRLFTTHAPLKRDYILVETIDTSNFKSTAKYISSMFKVTHGNFIQKHYVTNLRLLDTISNTDGTPIVSDLPRPILDFCLPENLYDEARVPAIPLSEPVPHRRRRVMQFFRAAQNARIVVENWSPNTCLTVFILAIFLFIGLVYGLLCWYKIKYP